MCEVLRAAAAVGLQAVSALRRQLAETLARRLGVIRLQQAIALFRALCMDSAFDYRAASSGMQ
jgi:hypothetical protein